MPDIKILNNYLSNFGKCDNSDGPLFRLVWSDEQFEHREGTFREFSGPLFIREVTGVKLVSKYPYLKERWILERWIPGVYCYNKEIPLSQWGSYEPIYVFESNKREYLSPNLKVIEVLIGMIHRHEGRKEGEIVDELLANEDKQVKEFMDMLEISEMSNALHMKEAIVVPSSYDIQKAVNSTEKVN